MTPHCGPWPSALCKALWGTGAAARNIFFVKGCTALTTKACVGPTYVLANAASECGTKLTSLVVKGHFAQRQLQLSVLLTSVLAH